MLSKVADKTLWRSCHD